MRHHGNICGVYDNAIFCGILSHIDLDQSPSDGLVESGIGASGPAVTQTSVGSASPALSRRGRPLVYYPSGSNLTAEFIGALDPSGVQCIPVTEMTTIVQRIATWAGTRHSPIDADGGGCLANGRFSKGGRTVEVACDLWTQRISRSGAGPVEHL